MEDAYDCVKVVPKLVGRMSFVFRGHPLSPTDRALMRVAFQVQTGLLLDLLPVAASMNQWIGFLGRGSSTPIDIERLSGTLKYVDGVVKRYAEDYCTSLHVGDGVPRCAADFKRLLCQQRLDWAFMAPLQPLIEAYFVNFDLGAARAINQWVNFLTHVTLRDVDLETELITEYIALEESMVSWSYPSDILSALNAIMRTWCEDLDPIEPRPRHGTGSVAHQKGVDKLRKYWGMELDPLLGYYLEHEITKPSASIPPCGFVEAHSTASRTSVLQCVPKSMTKNRTISMEPAALQYYQHGVRYQVDQWLQSQSILRGRIDLHDQELSQRMAWRGSISGAYATIDLSAASDTVTLDLVKGVFAHTVWFRRFICLRSQWTKLPDGNVVKLAKFAPMGSDLCFCTMCVVFACLCEYVVQECEGHISRKDDYRVYGDDIVIRTKYADRLCELLEQFHFKVNAAKSFTVASFHNFREACGIEALDGFDITPVRIPRRMRVDSAVNQVWRLSEPKSVAAVVELINEFFRRGFYWSRRLLITCVAEAFEGFDMLPYTDVDVKLASGWERQNDIPSSVSILTYDWCRTLWRCKKLTTAPRDLRQNWYCRPMYKVLVPVACNDVKNPGLCQVPEMQAVAEKLRYYEYQQDLDHRAYPTECGVIHAPEAQPGFRPRAQKWTRKWVL